MADTSDKNEGLKKIGATVSTDAEDRFPKITQANNISDMAPNETKKLAVLQNQHINILESVLNSRTRLSGALGLSYDGNRDLYKTLGWKKVLTYEDYEERYARDGVAKRIVNALPAATWRGKPLVSDNTEAQSPFEEKWKELVTANKIYNIFLRADILARIGDYSVIFLGFNDGVSPDKEVKSATELLYMTPYSQKNATIKKLNSDPTSPRFGKPEVYELDVSSVFTIEGTVTPDIQTKSIQVHWSRIIHIAEATLENDIFGTPALKAAFNYLMNIDLIAGGSGEMFWRGAFPGLSLNLQNDAEFQIDTDAMAEELDAYTNDMQRYLRTEGMDIKTITSQLTSPREFLETQMKLISATVGIPMRLLTGSERGQLASTQDERNWLIVINDRREDVAELGVIRPFIDRLIQVGVMSEPNEGKYQILWDDLFALGEKESAEIAEIKAKTLKSYTEAAALGAEQIVPVEFFQKHMLKLTDEEITNILDLQNEMLLLDLQPDLDDDLE